MTEPEEEPVTAYEMPELIISGTRRAEQGLLVTVRNQTTRHSLTLHETGPVLQAMRAIAAQIDAMDGTWQVVSVSSPATIYRDLQGTRYYRSADDSRQSSVDPRTAEINLLGRIGRLDLLAPLSAPGMDARIGAP